MAEKKDVPKPSIPKPSIGATPPVKPPVTNVDVEEVEKVEEPEVVEEAPPSFSDGVETDLVKRFLGGLIDMSVASVIGFFFLIIIGSSVLQWLVIGLVLLTKDSLPMLEGQSLGKKVMKTKAVKDDGSSLSGDWVTGATRNILFAFPVVGVVECFILLSRSGKEGNGRRLGDDWAKTKVISVD